MKPIKIILPLGTAVLAIGLAGCSKKLDPAAKAGPIATDSGSQPATLKLKWQTGKRYSQEMTMHQEAHMQVPDPRTHSTMPMEQLMNMSEKYSLDATKDLPDGGNELQMTFNNLKMDSKLAGRSVMNFDSDDDAKQDGKNPAASTFRKMIGVPIIFDTDTNGKIVKTVNFDDFMAKFADGDPQSKAMMSSMMNEDTLKQFASRGEGLPGKPVKIGDTWPFNMDINSGPMGKMKIDAKYTFKGWQDHDGHKCAVLGFVGDMSSKPGADQGFMKFTIENGKMTGDSWFDPEQGLMLDSIVDQTMDIKIQVQGQNIKSSTKQTVGIKLVEVTDIPK